MEKSKHLPPRTDGGWALRKTGMNPHDKVVVNHRDTGKHEQRQKKPTRPR
jgi:hypothetical protein